MFFTSISSRHTIEFKTADVLFIGFTALLSLLIVTFRMNVEDWQKLLLTNILAMGVYLFALWVTSKVRASTLKAVFRIGLYTVAVSYLFEATGKIIHIFFSGWFDEFIAQTEHSMLGVHPTVWLQGIISPALTEWMMFTYVIYGPMIPLIAYLAFKRGGFDGLEDYLTTLAIANIVCYAVFLLVPVDWPGRLLGDLHTVPLNGYFFTSIADSVRTDVHYPGGCLPSPHCAVTTVMMVAAYRYHRPTFIAVLPIVLSIYISTVYGRFHYATDVPTGILTAVFALWVSPKLQRVWKNPNVTLEIKRIFKPTPVPEVVREED